MEEINQFLQKTFSPFFRPSAGRRREKFFASRLAARLLLSTFSFE
jgi:hypothetical protein